MDSVEAFLRQWSVRCFYHFTDTRNLSSIARHGLLSWAELTRRGIAVPAPGGNDWSRDADALAGMDRYVHLCLAPNHPMEYIARVQDKRIQESRFLRIAPEVLYTAGAAFTAGVSNRRGVDRVEIAQASREMKHLDAIYCARQEGWWQDRAFLERLRAAEKYELLIPDHIPVKQILDFRNG